MKRLTDRARAAVLKKIIDSEFEVTEESKIYVALAEYENADEEFEIFRKTHTATLYKCDPTKNKECKSSACYIYGGECHHTLSKRFAKEGD